MTEAKKPDPILSRVVNEDLDTQERYSLISNIEDQIADILNEDVVRVVTYVADESMESSDMRAFEDMMQAVQNPENLFLFINSPGGDPETALRIIRMCRERSKCFRTIIPDMAKSAATQVCLGSEEIWMGHNSELGPIDPQIQFKGRWTPAKTIVDGLEFIENRAKQNDDVPTQLYSAMAQHYDPAKLKEAQNSIEYIREASVDLLEDMVENQEEAEDCVDKLLNLDPTNEDIPHTKAIDIDRAIDMNLKIRDLRELNEVWDDIWELYIRSELVREQRNITKLWENDGNTMHMRNSSHDD